MMKRIILSLLSVSFFLTGYAPAQQIGVLRGEGRHDTEFNAVFQEFPSWKVSYYECSKEGMSNLVKDLDKLDVVIAVPLFNWKKSARILQKGDTDTASIKRYLEKGGSLIITDGSYDTARSWLAEIDPSLGGLKTGGCNSSQWQVIGYVSSTEPVHTLRNFPNKITEGNSWPHFEEPPKDSKWKVLARCSEGKPVGLFQEVGKGYVYLTCLRQPFKEPIENYVTYSVLRGAGLSVAASEMKPMTPGKNTMSIELESEPPKGTGLKMVITDDKGKETSFSTNFVGKVCALAWDYDKRGTITQKLLLTLPAGDRTLFTRTVKLPKIMEIEPNAYRGILSTRRREKDVDFLVKFAPGDRDLTGATLDLAFYSSLSNRVYQTSLQVPTNEVPARWWVPVELPKDLAAAGYEVRASLRKGRMHFRDEAPFEILAPRPAQCIIDEDTTMLVNGTPYFPLGIYHSASQFHDLQQIGFNACQFWKWEESSDYGAPIGMYNAFGHGLRCLFESHHGPGQYLIDKFADHPGMLMWYVADEPAEASILQMTRANNIWHADKQHPTYICSCRPDLYHVHKDYCDVLGFNPNSGKSRYHYVTNVIRCIKLARDVSEGRKCLVLVPGALSPKNVESAPAVAYAAIVHDIRGFFWYCWKQAGGGPLGIGLNANPEGQKIMKKLLAEIKKLVPGLTSVGRRMFEEGDLHGIVCPNAKAKERCVVLYNCSEKELKVDTEIPELVKVKTVKDAFTGEDTKDIVAGRVTVTLPPMGRAAYTW